MKEYILNIGKYVMNYSSRTCIFFTLSMCKNILKTYKKSRLVSKLGGAEDRQWRHRV